MSTEQLEYTQEELAQYSQSNAAVFLLLPLAYFKEQNLPIADWANFATKKMQANWANAKGAGAKALARTIGMNMISSGFKMTSFSGNDEEAKAVLDISSWETLMQPLGLTYEDFDTFVQAFFTALLASIDLEFSYSREGSIISWKVFQ